MKNYIIIGLVLFFGTVSCTEIIELDLEESNPSLVIDGSMDVKSEAYDKFSADVNVSLSLSGNYYDDRTQTKSINNATVTLIENKNEISIKRILNAPTTVDGHYFFYLENVSITSSYALEISYNNQTFRSSKETLLRTPEIDKLEASISDSDFQTDDDEDRQKALSAVIYFKDDPNEANYYLVVEDNPSNTYEKQLDLRDDEFSAEEDFAISVYHRGILNNEKVSNFQFTLYQISEKYFSYMSLINEQGSDNISGNRGGGGGSGTLPSPIRGNIVNITDEKNFPLGYFRVVEPRKIKIETSDNQ